MKTGPGKTERLHYDDPLALELESTVLEVSAWQGAPSVVLDRTVFYPESGGQLGDRGTLGGVAVDDVQVDGEGRVHHLVKEPLEVGATVRGRVDGARRRENMALHTGQHALSRALLDELGAVTVSSRLGATACTIDVDLRDLSLAQLKPVEDRVNALIDEDRPVRQLFPDDAELERLSLRKPPPETDRVRVVDIAGFDVTPCGGTHVTHTAQIELVWIEAVERYKGGTRITFSAGPRARRALMEQSKLLRDAATELTCAPPEVEAIARGLKGKLDDARREAGALRGQLAGALAASLEKDGDVVAMIDADVPLMKAVAERLATGSRLVALAAAREDGTDVLITRGPEGEVACGDLLREVAKAAGGRGGGRPQHAQGRLPVGVDWVTAVRDGLKRLD
ncbi:MAG TPA: alanyl-tRNA editing protein [Myxococcales bacterium]|nr:alanyl-tRNA editing protein [Myxococcales bacterium]